MSDASSLMQRFRLDGQVAVVTGAAAGIGRATAALFAAAGARVVLADRDEEGAASAARTIGEGASAKALDVTDEPQVEAAFREVVMAHGRLDILVNNAGIAIRRPALDLSLEDWNAVVARSST
jgi:NAD(P)-dependent dehydrogenase (short-subunit alcohol dehydrogenase family)